MESLKRAQEIVRVLTAVEILGYEDQNWLAGSPRVRSKNKQELLGELGCILNKLEEKEG